MDEPAIDAVAMVRRIRDRHAELLKNATAEEKIRFYNGTAATPEAAVGGNRSEGDASQE